MPTPTRKGPFVVCPKSGRIVGFASASGWRFLWIPCIGLAALLWILIRVVPKPSRAHYPCQQAAIPLASGFIGYLLSLPAAVLAYRKGREHVRRARYFVAGLCFLTAGVAGIVQLCITEKNAYAAFVTRNPPNTPLGQGHGIFPGRVAWVYDPAAVSWKGDGHWYDDAYNNQTAIDRMVSQAVRCVGGQATDAAAWDALFHSFNRRTGRGDVGYTRGEKIAIKINENNVNSHANNNDIDASPHMVLALLRQLIKQAGVAESAITVFDASRFITDNVFDKSHAEFPGVIFVDHIGGDGRVQATFVTNAIPGSVPSTNQKDLATCAMEAKYIIDMALLKGHVALGVTLCAKNFFGVTAIETDWHKNGSRHHGFDPKKSGDPSYAAFADYLGHPDLGGKTLLYMIDGLYGDAAVSGAPATKWKMTPFNNGPCASLFASEDGVAIDSVGIDFLISEFPGMPDLPYCDNYLQEAALANDPPSHTVYKPDGVHVITNSLGIAEHWNNPHDKQYSRNLGPSGTGIELISIAPESKKGARLDFNSPPPGERSPITGKFTGVEKPADYKLLILVSNDRKRWWDKTHISKSIPVETNGTFNIETWVSDPHDLTVSYIGIWAVPANFDTTAKNYGVEGAPLPEKVTNSAVASQIKGRQEVPQLDFVPPALNTSNAIIGKVTGTATPTDYKLVLLLSRDQKIWWDKTHNVNGITIQPDGTFTVKGWANVPRTLTTPYMGVWLVPKSFDLGAPNFKVEGAAVPENLTRAAVAMKIKSREPSEEAKPDATKAETTANPAATTDATVLGAGAVAGAVVDFEAPTLGSNAPITGKLSGVPNPADYQVLILVSADRQRWWDKTHNVHGVPVQSDGTFAIKSWAVDPHDLTVANVGIWIVPKSFDISWDAYQVEGRPLPDKVKQAAATVKIQRRERNAEVDFTPAR